MAVITISRGSFSGGKNLAECLADTLGYRCVDLNVIVERAAAFGVAQNEVRLTLERPPSFRDRLSHRKSVLLALIQAALTEEVRGGNAVYHGLAGHLLLRGISHVLRARIIAPMRYRAIMVEERLKLDHDEAVAYAGRMDRDRNMWTRHLYGVDWGDPGLYDLVLNLEYIDIGRACEIISSAARLPCFRETTESKAAMEDLALSSRVRAKLACSTNVNGACMELDISAHGGHVIIRGRVASRRQKAEIKSVAGNVSGVRRVDLEDSSISPESKEKYN